MMRWRRARIRHDPAQRRQRRPELQRLPVASVTVHITDNDSPGVVVTESSGGTDVAEGGATDNYSMKLTTQPTANVTVTLFTGAHATANPSQLVFTPANWNMPAGCDRDRGGRCAGGGRPHGVDPAQAPQRDPNYNGLPSPASRCTSRTTTAPTWS